MSKLRKCYLKDIATSQTGPFGSQLHEEDYVNEGTPIVTVEHLGEIGFTYNNLPLVSDVDKERLSKYILKEGDIVFSRVGSVDRCSYVSEKEAGWLFSGRCIRVRFNEKADARFIGFYFRQKYFKEMMLNISVGATMPSLNTSLMDNIPLFLPTLEIQQKIANVLSVLDTKIALNNRINAELEAMAKTLYDYWFVQFDFPNEENKPYKTSGGAMVWNEELKREIPESWEVQDLSNIIEIKYGKDHKKLDFGLIPVFGSGGIMRYVDKALYDKESILIPRKGTLTNLFYINKPFWSVDTMFFSKMKIANIGKYLFYFLQSLNLASLNAGTAVPSLTTEILNQLPIVTPTPNIIKRFDTILTPVYEMKEQIIKENQQLSTLRDWLLPMLMNGQVMVGEK